MPVTQINTSDIYKVRSKLVVFLHNHILLVSLSKLGKLEPGVSNQASLGKGINITGTHIQQA